MTNTTKHTPGPWWVAPNGTSIMCGNPGDPEIVATTAVGDIMGVCNRQCATMLGFDGRDSFDGWDESEANAALIAQAPALLARVAELEAALEMADKWEADGRPDGIMHLIARLRAALAGGAK